MGLQIDMDGSGRVRDARIIGDKPSTDATPEECKAYLTEWAERLRKDAYALSECILASEPTRSKSHELAISAVVALIELRRHIEAWEIE